METTKVTLNETSIPTNYKLNLMDKMFFEWDETKTNGLFSSLLSTVAYYLYENKVKDSKDGKIGMKFLDFKNNFLLGAIVTYHPIEDGEEGDDTKGNWSLELTFDENDLNGIENIYDNMNAVFVEFANNRAKDIMNGYFSGKDTMYKMFIEAINTLKTYLEKVADDKAKDIQEDGMLFEVTVPGYATFAVGIENGEKVFSITPGEIIKQLIKDDTTL